jgi:negative regulator of sigma-B (phosphoserine phosphatase)
MSSLIVWGHAARPFAGESESGDWHVVAPFEGGVLLAVIDGLGHGSEAAAASRLAADVLTSQASLDPVELMRRCHQRLRGSRGAAVLLLSLFAETRTFAWAGVGNVEGVCLRRAPGPGTAREALLSAGGVVGYQLPALPRRQATLEIGDLFVLASDGISPGFIEDVAVTREPNEIATTILAKHGRATDDALVLAARYQGGQT